MSLDPLDNQNLMLDTIVFNKLVQNLPNLREVDLSYVNMFLAEPISLMNLSSSLSSLQLMECGLQGEFPGKLLQRPKLRVLDLRGNDHCLPRSNWSCSLETLYLSYTKIAIHLEHDLISNLRSVKRLSLGGCNFVGSNAAFFGDLRQLHELSIPLDNFSGQIPAVFENLKHLTLLSLSSNKFSGQIPPSLANLNQLISLFLFNNNLNGHFQHNSLIYIYLSNNKLEGAMPSSVCKLKLAQVHDFSNNSFNDFIPHCLGRFSNDLLVLHLGMNNFHGSIRTSFSNNNSLMYLNFNGNLLERRIPSTITNCKNLEVLDIGNNKIDDTFPVFWHTLKQLQVLILQSNKLHGSLKDAIGNYSFSKLRIFDISNNSSSGPWPLEYFISLEAMIVPNQEIEYMRLVDLIFLSVFHVSHYQLEGHIPLDKQLDTFDSNSYEGNPRLCGFPLRKACENGERQLVTPLEEDSKSENGFGWKAVLIGDICSFVFGI
ncbi:receptor-like protein 9DC3 [Hevea brasiliensis]|uniref:receptor-like protein 9DC3 n=1 Tax=Hevea brasiliensis TaxID=3981 RepID=UPI0025EBEDDD|nr:receptor-like protein 9DC3 [Hevea brasiliensis]